MPSDPIVVVHGIFAAYEKKDRVALDALLTSDFHFSSPIDNHLDRATYFELCWPNSRQISKFELSTAASSGDRVFVHYVAETIDGRRFCNSELFTVRGGQVAEVQVYFGWSIPHPAAAGTHLVDTKTKGGRNSSGRTVDS
jgi:ketosteroid isomerase-like protein